LKNCQKIETDILPSREDALTLMTKRHIEGVKQWKPLAKKQFFAVNYNNGKGQSIKNLSNITGISENEIRGDLRDYRLFFSTYEKYCKKHTDFTREIIDLNTDPFWRLFKAKFEYPVGNKTSPKDFFQIIHDELYNSSSAIDNKSFEKIILIAFEKAVVKEEITTRHVLTDIQEILPLLDKISKKNESVAPEGDQLSSSEEQGFADNEADFNASAMSNDEHGRTTGVTGNDTHGPPLAGGPKPGGPAPKKFFETISWHDKLNPNEKNHQGLLAAIYELYSLSNIRVSGKKSYEMFPIATGMVLRTVYEQALRIRLIQTKLWGKYCKTLKNDSFPILGGMEDFIGKGENKSIVLPKKEMVLVFDRIIAAKDREFLNSNIHYTGNINVSPSTLEGIAKGGMYLLVESIINLLP
jgi:hypothetical protein